MLNNVRSSYSWHLILLQLLFIKGQQGFFIKHANSGLCLMPLDTVDATDSFGDFYLLQFTQDCLSWRAQFHFVDDEYLENIDLGGTVTGNVVNNKFGVYVTRMNKSKERGATFKLRQTKLGSLIQEGFKGEKFCASPLTSGTPVKTFVSPTTTCDMESQKFLFGSVTCEKTTVSNANCNKNQVILIEKALYGRQEKFHNCGSIGNSDCRTSATCVVKRECEGQSNCKFRVTNEVIGFDPCSGYTKDLYFEYRCVNKMAVANIAVRLTGSILPNEGVIGLIVGKTTRNVCTRSLTNKERETVCRQLGYRRGITKEAKTSVLKPEGKDLKTFTGSISCGAGEDTLSKCCIDYGTTVDDCSHLAYISCFICSESLLEDKRKFPESAFTASGSQKNHAAAQARISSNSSWCAPSNGDHFLDIDLGRSYVINSVKIFGDSELASWVSTYKLFYRSNKNTRLKPIDGGKEIPGNTNPFGMASTFPRTNARVLRFIPVKFDGQPCMRIEICGHSVYPDPVENLTVASTAAHSATFSMTLPLNTGGGSLLNIQVKLIRGETTVKNFKVRAFTGRKTQEVDVTGLTPYTRYKLSVAAGNNRGFGDERNISFITSETAPSGPPRNISMLARDSSSLAVSWKEPAEDKRNGVIRDYTVCISTSDDGTCIGEYSTSKKDIDIEKLNASTKYFVRIRASTMAGAGVYSSSHRRYTNGERIANSTKATSGTLSFALQPVKGNFSYSQFIVLKLTDNQRPSKSPDSYSSSDLVSYAEAKQSSEPKPYIAAAFDSSNTPAEFVLGDNTSSTIPRRRRRRSTTNYYNGPLEAGTSYSVFQRFYENDNEYFSTDWSTPFRTAGATQIPQEETGSGKDNLPVIIGVIVAVLLLLFLGAAFILFWRRRSKKYGKAHDNVNVDLSLKTCAGLAKKGNNLPDNEEDEQDFVDSFVKNGQGNEYENEIEVAESLYCNEAITASQQPRGPIPVPEFELYVHDMKTNSEYNFRKEFKMLPSGHLFSWDVAKRSFNKAKNRYGNIVTYDSSRVVLSGDEKADYINASFIDGKITQYYIATQGPKPKTTYDFWKMVFEHKCPTIVMLTGLVEIGKVKCEKYWPDDYDTYGDLTVTTKETREFADHVTRCLTLEKNDERHHVVQFHFTNWPDHGVPHYPTQLLSFRRHFKSVHNKRTGPVVVHCSAGVGRTGVFIAVDKIIDELDVGVNSVDVFGTVKEMRTKRMDMVQTGEQYVFIHDAVLDHIKCGINEVDASNLRIEINTLGRSNPKGKTGFEEKFKRLNDVSPRMNPEKCEAALLPENKLKNRNANIFPCEVSRVYLSHLEDVENSDYINACYVDGYLGKNYFIATQTPLPETINDFWRMIFEHKSSTVLMLNQLKENDQEYPIFWPTERAKPRMFGSMTLQLDSATKKNDIILRKFIISSSPFILRGIDSSQFNLSRTMYFDMTAVLLKAECCSEFWQDLQGGRALRLIQYLGWPDHGSPQNNSDVLKLLNHVESSQRTAEEGPVTVMCSDSAGRTGTFIAICNLVDRVKIVQVVDPFQCIKQIRSKRSQFVENADQFKVCYEVVDAVLGSFDEYSNFEIKET